MKSLLQKAGVLVLAMIEENIQNGVDYTGKPFAYSKLPFWKPFDQSAYTKMGKASGYGKFFEITESKDGKLGMIMLGGYDEYKKIMNPNSYSQFLTVTGKLLRSMKVQEATETSAVIGFTGDRNINIAFWLNVSGAGRGRKLWKFLGISPAQRDKLVNELTEEARELFMQKLNYLVGRTSQSN
jgi:hypothetical protein